MLTEYDSLYDIYGGKLSPLDIHYLSTKCFGVRDLRNPIGRPSLNMLDDSNLYHITFGTSEEESPYSIENQTILYHDKPLPFRVDFVERCPIKVGRYFYYRHANHLTPTLDDELVLNLTFQRQCFCCDFCQYKLYKSQPNITPEEGFKRISSETTNSDLSDISCIAVVTGLFGNGEKALNHMERIIDLAVQRGFRGGFFYMGFELGTPSLVERLAKKIQEVGLAYFRIAYTVEMFSNRSRLIHGKKAHDSIDEIAILLRDLKSAGADIIEYTYIPGLDDLTSFKEGSAKLAQYAYPHICIFRPWKQGQRLEQIHPEYAKKGPAYLCEMRLFYEDLYGGPIYGNQLANLWPFPLKRVDIRWSKGIITGEDEYLRYWKDSLDPRRRCLRPGCETTCNFFQKYHICLYDEKGK